MTQGKKIPDEQRNSIIENYKLGSSYSMIALKFNISKTTVAEIIKSADIPECVDIQRRNRIKSHRRYSFDESAFDTVTEASAYFVGLLITDGCVSIKKDSSSIIELCLAERDIDIIKKFKIFVKSNHPIRHIIKSKKKGYSNQAQYKIVLYSSHMAESLAHFGVTPKKSFTAKISFLDNNLHFWRGAIDGDGWILINSYNYKSHKYSYPTIGLCGSKFLMEQFLIFAKSILPKCRVAVHPAKKIYTIRFQGSSAYKIIGYLYGNCEIALNRKLKTARKIFEHFGDKYKGKVYFPLKHVA